MGYTHYFAGLATTAEVLADARKIIDTAPVLGCGPQGEGLPILSEANGIKLNGFAAAGESYETFPLPGVTGMSSNLRWFCTTAYKPYDVVATAILIATAMRSPGSLRSDGCLDDWRTGTALYEKAVAPLSDAPECPWNSISKVCGPGWLETGEKHDRAGICRRSQLCN